MANPNPSPGTRFKPGVSGNPGGKSSQQVENERKAAEIAAELRVKMLSSMQEKIAAGADVLDFMDPAALKLFKDSEDRAHGTPKQSLDHQSSDGSMTPQVIERQIVKADNSDR